MTDCGQGWRLSAELRRLEAAGHHVDDLLATVAAAGNLDDVEDIGSLLRHRVVRLAETYQPRWRERSGLIAGLLPRAEGNLADDDRAAFEERERLMEARADAVLARARARQESWLTQLPEPRSETGGRALRVIAAYRDRWQVSAVSTLGPLPDNDIRRIDFERAHLHLNALLDDAEDGQAPLTSPNRPKQQQHRDF
ncbi:hypothetical protein QDX23_07600 [Auritidibacter ignavus]|uniref:hypothetical protein n=1 Tax=Auritidibacter ignavus TaxID=678932 RepID=UPI000D72B881|nr:hypothetical protein [Auritidibacter ignavus]PXA74999.1 hypothetical protein DCC26_11290 [Auritidibacter sp. NML120779]WGH90002.1 hypothetical protein QDX23_07600 [Auritidibacter ignavus]WHS29330.1 hypothetical protein QM395_06370 [Auritidibacter ignavus]